MRRMHQHPPALQHWLLQALTLLASLQPPVRGASSQFQLQKSVTACATLHVHHVFIIRLVTAAGLHSCSFAMISWDCPSPADLS